MTPVKLLIQVAADAAWDYDPVIPPPPPPPPWTNKETN